MLIQLALLTVLINQLYSFLYPEDYNRNINIIKHNLETNLMTLSYNSIYYYSVCQIYFNKYMLPHICLIWSSTINFLQKNNLINKKICLPSKVLSVYKNGREIESFICNDDNDKLGSTQNMFDNLKYIDNSDLVILSDKKLDSNCVNKIHCKQYDKYIDYTYSNLNFISMDITYKSITYPIILKNDFWNHYIVDNILNKEFFKYYLTNILNIKIEDDFDYNLTLIDNDVIIHELTSRQILVIKQNTYEIQNMEYSVTENNTQSENTTEEIENQEESDNSLEKSYHYVTLE